MARRHEFQHILEETLGSRNVYFQPPSSIKMVYPAIVYKRDSMDTDYADDGVYKQVVSYEVTLIERNADSDTTFKLSKLPLSRFSRHYVVDNLYHDVFTIFY